MKLQIVFWPSYQFTIGAGRLYVVGGGAGLIIYLSNSTLSILLFGGSLEIYVCLFFKLFFLQYMIYLYLVESCVEKWWITTLQFLTHHP